MTHLATKIIQTVVVSIFINYLSCAITIIAITMTTTIKMIVPQPELNVSKKLSPFFLDNNPTINAMIIIPINIDIKIN